MPTIVLLPLQSSARFQDESAELGTKRGAERSRLCRHEERGSPDDRRAVDLDRRTAGRLGGPAEEPRQHLVPMPRVVVLGEAADDANVPAFARGRDA